MPEGTSGFKHIGCRGRRVFSTKTCLTEKLSLTQIERYQIFFYFRDEEDFMQAGLDSAIFRTVIN